MSDDEISIESVDIGVSGSDTSLSTLSSENSVQDSELSITDAREWFAVDRESPPPAPPHFPFSGQPSVNCEFNLESSELEYFEKFFDDELIQIITNETNTYSVQNNYNGIPITANDIRVFLAIIILQSIVKKPDLQHYWSKNPLLLTPFFSQTISYRRFLDIKKYLHFSNNEAYDESVHPSPKLNKIWPVLDNLSKKFSSLLTPERDITIDESLLMFKGRLGWIQYIPLKRAKFGIKIFMLCESKSGYVWNLIIYTGRGTTLATEYSHLPLSSQVVINLAQPLFDKGYCLTMDNFYNSPQLADFLISKKTDVYGTLRLNRKGVPATLKTTKLRKGEITGFQRGKVTVMKWKDKKDVSLLSTVHSLQMSTVEKRQKQMKKPQAVVDYNDTMGGVDRVDQHLAEYATPRKRGKKYYKKIFFHLLDLALWNSFVLYKKSGGTKLHLDFRLALVNEILKKYHNEVSSPRIGRPSTTPNPLRLSGRHFPEYLPPSGKKINHTRQCAVCSRVRDHMGKKIRRESRFYCPDCDVALCVSPCFRVYHTVANI